MTRAANQGGYSKWAGVYGVISNLTLYDGNVVLSNLTDAGFWSGFKYFNKPNQYNDGIGRYQAGNDLKHSLNRSDSNTSSNGLINFGLSITDDVVKGLITTAVEGTTFKGQLKLRMIYDMLQKLQYIDTSVFRNFRIVIEFNNQISRSALNNVNVQNNLTTRPLLVVEEVIDEDIIDSVMGKVGVVSWNEMENDLVNVPAVSSGGGGPLANGTRYFTQEQNFHLNSFNNKSLGRMLIWKQPVLAANLVDGNNRPAHNGIYNSTEFLGEVEQVRINGRGIFSRAGIEGSNRRLAHLVDAWGEVSLYPMGNELADQQTDAISRQRLNRNGNEDIGSSSFVGMDLAGEKAQDLQINFTRRCVFLNGGGGGIGDTTRTNLSKYNASHNLQIWCEVKKALVPNKDGSYNIVYV